MNYSSFTPETMYECQQTTLYFALKNNGMWQTTHSLLFTLNMTDKWESIRYFDKIWMANDILCILYNICYT